MKPKEVYENGINLTVEIRYWISIKIFSLNALLFSIKYVDTNLM